MHREKDEGSVNSEKLTWLIKVSLFLTMEEKADKKLLDIQKFKLGKKQENQSEEENWKTRKRQGTKRI